MIIISVIVFTCVIVQRRKKKQSIITLSEGIYGVKNVDIFTLYISTNRESSSL